MSHEYTLTDYDHERRLDASAEWSAFVDNAGLDELASMYGVELPDDSHERHERLALLQSTAIEYWDFRKGAERQAVSWESSGALGEEGSEVWQQVFNAADRLGMVQSGELQNKRPTYLAILGGANRAPLDRLQFGLKATEDFDSVVYLGSSRKLSEAEKEKAADYAPGAATEHDLGVGAFTTLLGAQQVNEVHTSLNGDFWSARYYTFNYNGAQKHGFVLSTPFDIHNGSGTSRRATTYDNFRFFAALAEFSKEPTASVAAVTTGFYVPGQHLPAVQEITLPYGVTVETIGHSAEYSGMQRKPTQLLQETKSAIDAAARLENAINEAAQRQ